MRQWRLRRQHYNVLLIVLLLILLLLPFRPGYRAMRAIGRVLPGPSTEGVLYSDNFKLLYDSELEEAEAVLQLLETARSDLVTYLPDRTPKPIIVRMHQSQDSLQRALGGDYAPTLGAYYLGKLEILGPLAWRPDLGFTEALSYYAAEGPLVHELAHMFLDFQTHGRYPVWFSEGFAQYWEMRLRGYVWDEGDSGWRDAPYSLAELTAGFTFLPEADAYQQSLNLIHFLYESIGDLGMNSLMHDLERGQGFQAAFQANYGADLIDFEREWRAWLLVD